MKYVRKLNLSFPITHEVSKGSDRFSKNEPETFVHEQEEILNSVLKFEIVHSFRKKIQTIKHASI